MEKRRPNMLVTVEKKIAFRMFPLRRHTELILETGFTVCGYELLMVSLGIFLTRFT